MRIWQLKRTLRSSLSKNGPEIQAFVTGNMPSFVIHAGRRAADVPVFFFHDVEPGRFEAQLRYLGENGYRTLDADQLEARLRRPQSPDDDRDDSREVALTFDDATWTFWAYVFPLLRRHQARAILFAIPGIVPDDPASYPNLADLWAGRCSAAEIAARAKVQPLCTWRELRALHDTGVVDIQSHSLTHALVPVSARIDDFVQPGFDAGAYANANLPIASSDDPRQPKRRLRLGMPVFEARSRLCGRPRFLEAPELAQALVDHVAGRGGAGFFERPSWRRELAAVLDAWPTDRRGGFETPEQTREAIRDELALSKELLESRLPGKAVRHFCYPWFDGCDLADQLAASLGYRTVHGGVGVSSRDGTAMPLPVQRISEEYLFRLPGEGRGGIAPVWLNRVRGFMAKAARTP
jgi:peptidoglycan/xylan/chitin deacetylase (PgdA/CDA1 family)